MTDRYQGEMRMSGLDQLIWNLTRDQDLFCIWGIAEFDEPLKKDLVYQSLTYLIQNVPILNSRVVENPWSAKWIFLEKTAVDDLITGIVSDSDDEARKEMERVFLNPIDARQDSKIRIITIKGPAVFFLVIQVHHIAMDGEGLKRVCVMFADIYRTLESGGQWEPAVEPAPCRSWGQIAKHFSFRHVWLIPKAYALVTMDMVVSALRNRLTYKIKGDVSPDNPPVYPLPPYFDNITIEREVMTAIKAFAEKRRVTVNDILMSSLSMAVHAWNHDRGDRRSWLTYAYTANLRRWWGEPEGTFGNFSAIIKYEENTANLDNPQKALAATAKRMGKVKSCIGLDGFFTLACLKVIPYILVKKMALGIRDRLLAALKESQAMTNIGIIFAEAGDFGHVRAKGYSFLAPTFPGGCIVYTVTTYDHLTTIHLGCSEDYLTRASARNFLNLWKRKICGIINLSVSD